MRKIEKLFEILTSEFEESTVWKILKAMSKWHIGEVIEILKHVRNHDKE